MPLDESLALAILPITGIGEVSAGVELGEVLAEALGAGPGSDGNGGGLRDGDVVVVTQKVVSKAEGRVVPLDHADPAAKAAVVAGESVRISVRDSGPGVPEELLVKIFQPFFRVDDSRDSSTGGVGLGLAIAYRAVSVHHGRLWAQNVNPGLNVWIELPVAA